MPRPRASRLRVHGGQAGGRRLTAPAGVRPTQGLVKEAIFNMLGEAVVGARVLDLFSGSGALGIEALSRGAAVATFVERSGASVSILRRNLESLGYDAQAKVVRAEAVRWLQANPGEVQAASLAFIDPPYADDALAPALRALDAALPADGIVVAEHARGASLPALNRLREWRAKLYGDTGVTLFRAGP